MARALILFDHYVSSADARAITRRVVEADDDRPRAGVRAMGGFDRSLGRARDVLSGLRRTVASQRHTAS